MTRDFTCIICPNGCEIHVETEGDQIRSIEGFHCPKGENYVRQEMTAPMRTISTSVLVEDGVLPLASVRLTNPIPRERIFDAMEEIKNVRVKAPVTMGTVVIKGILGYDSDVIITKNVENVQAEKEQTKKPDEKA